MSVKKRSLTIADLLSNDEPGTSKKSRRDGEDASTSRAEGSEPPPGPDPSPAPALQELLDLTPLITDAAVQRRFDDIAHALLHRHKLVLRSPRGTVTEYELLEVEFYLRKDGCHEDPYTHGSEEQRDAGRWYFHRAPRKSYDSTRSATSATGYRGGTRKGLDLTMGGPVTKMMPRFSAKPETPESNARGGILLRTIRRLEDGVVISGPSVLVDEILRAGGAPKISDLVADVWNFDTSAFEEFALPPADKAAMHVVPLDGAASAARPPVVYHSPRVGLDLSHPGTTATATHPRAVFVARHYRYFTDPTVLTSNGRLQTFVGVYRALRRAGRLPRDDKAARLEISGVSGIRCAAVENYLKDIHTGEREGRLEAFVGAAGKGVYGSSSKYLQMIGVLSRVVG